MAFLFFMHKLVPKTYIFLRSAKNQTKDGKRVWIRQSQLKICFRESFREY